MYRIGSPAVRNDDAGVLAGQDSRLDHSRAEIACTCSVFVRLGDQHDERRQVVVERAEAVRSPCAEARPAGDLVAGLHVA